MGQNDPRNRKPSGLDPLAVSPAVTCLVVALLAGIVSWRSDSQLRTLSRLPKLPDSGVLVTLRTDPTTTAGVTTAIASLHRTRVRLVSRGAIGSALTKAESGNTVVVSGSMKQVPMRSWRVARHLVGDFHLTAVGSLGAGSVLSQIANRTRHVILASTKHFEPTDRALFAGFVLGDDRGQPPWVADDFRAAGLTHLLVVSGQNVAFVLAVAQPLLRRFRRRGRFAASLALLLLFAAVTRFEPSVLRASAMAAISLGLRTQGRPQRSLRVLSMAVVVLVCIDPLLTWSLGFILSVGACVGLSTVTPWVERHLERVRLPHSFRTMLAATVGAQVGTLAPMIWAFQGVPVLSILANIVALPAAAPVMVWGLAVGVPTGLAVGVVGSGPARLLQIPTQICLRWVTKVAETVAQIPLAEVQLFTLVLAIAGSAALSTLWWSWGAKFRWSLPGGLVVGLTFVLPLLGPIVWAPRVQFRTIERGALAYNINGHLGRTADVLVLSHGVRTEPLLAALRRNRIRAVHLVVIRSGGRPQAQVVSALSKRVDVGAVLVGERAFSGHVRPVIVARPQMALQANEIRVAIQQISSAGSIAYELTNSAGLTP